MKLILGVVAVLFAVQQAEAKPARCFSTDDGSYDCNFIATDGDGSFTISAPNKPTFIMLMNEPGSADAFGDFGTGRNVPLPGPYYRAYPDRACWVSFTTQDKICVW